MTAPQKSLSALGPTTVGLGLMLGGLGVLTVFAGPTGPLPIHYNAYGQANYWVSRELLGSGLVGLAFLTLLLGLVLARAVKRAVDPARSGALRYGQRVVQSIPVLSLLFASASLSGTTEIGGAVPMALLSLLFLLVGAFLGRVGTNRFVGVRTPWTFKSRLAWERSNRLAGRLLFIIGLAGLLTSPFAPRPFGVYAILISIGVAATWSVIESWRVWRSDPDRQPF